MKAEILVKSNRVQPPGTVYCVLAVLVVFDWLLGAIWIDFAQPFQHHFSRLAEGCCFLTARVVTEQLQLALQLVGCAIEDPFNLIFINNY